MKILVTSSTGLTGKAVVKALAQAGAEVHAMIHSDHRRNEMLSLGATETVIASIESEKDILSAMEGMDAVFYICPTAHPHEREIGKMAVKLAQTSGVERFVYQSVHNSIEPTLPHHRQKLQVEQAILESGLKYSILRPAAFMQNILGTSDALVKSHIFIQRFFKDLNATNRINMIDVSDYAAIAAKVSSGTAYDFGVYDLCGPQNLSVEDMLHALTSVLGADIQLQYISDEEFIQTARRKGMAEENISTLTAMFEAYNRFGFTGNSVISNFLLGREPKTFHMFLSEYFSPRT